MAVVGLQVLPADRATQASLFGGSCFLESFDLSIGKYDDEFIESVVALGGRGAFTYAVVLIFAARCQPHYHSARLLRRLVDVAHHVVGGRLLDLEDVSVENRVGIFERIGRQLAGRIEASFHRYIVLVNIRQQGRLADDSFPEQYVRRGDVLRLLVVSMQAAYFYDMPSGGLRVEIGVLDRDVFESPCERFTAYAIEIGVIPGKQQSGLRQIGLEHIR